MQSTDCCWTRSTSWAATTAATPPRPCWRCWTASRTATFRDHFLEVPFDLSDVLFITTANDPDTIPRPLLDRMEVIELTSYTDEEKLQIAKQPSAAQGDEAPRPRTRRSLKVTDGAIREIITGYTRESGVRVLERELAAMCRKAAMRAGAPMA